MIRISFCIFFANCLPMMMSNITKSLCIILVIKLKGDDEEKIHKEKPPKENINIINIIRRFLDGSFNGNSMLLSSDEIVVQLLKCSFPMLESARRTLALALAAGKNK